MRGSSNWAEIMVAAGRTSPKYSLSTGQHRSKSEPFGLSVWIYPLKQTCPAKLETEVSREAQRLLHARLNY